jgi:hypothetical protein
VACNACETGFQGYQAIVVTVQKSGNNALLYVGNQGRNIVLLRRILLCWTTPAGDRRRSTCVRLPIRFPGPTPPPILRRELLRSIIS